MLRRSSHASLLLVAVVPHLPSLAVCLDVALLNAFSAQLVLLFLWLGLLLRRERLWYSLPSWGILEIRMRLLWFDHRSVLRLLNLRVREFVSVISPWV